jgi:predicted DNA-binding WGR domain protein
MPVMPDTRIPMMGGESQQAESPLKTLGSLMQIKESQQLFKMRQLEAERKQMDYDDDLAVRDSLQQHARPEDAMEALRAQGRHGAYFKLGKDVSEQRFAEHKENDAKLELNRNQLEMAAQMLASVDDDAKYQPVRKAAVAMAKGQLGDGAEDLFPTVYDKAKVDYIVNMGTKRAEQIQMQRATEAARIDNANMWTNRYHAGMATGAAAAKGSGIPLDPNAPNESDAMLKTRATYQEHVARELDAAVNKPAYDAILAREYERGGDDRVLDKFKNIQWDPRIGKDGKPVPTNHRLAIKALGMSLPDRGQLEISAFNAETSAQRAEDAVIAAQQREYMDRIRERRLQEALDFRESGGEGGGGGRRGLTEKQRHDEADAIEAKFTKIDEQTKAQYDENPYFNRFVPDKTNPNKGTYSRVDVAPDSGESAPAAFPYGIDKMQQLPDEHPLKQTYIKKRINVQNQYRDRLLGHLPTIEEAAREAVRNQDAEGYAKLEEEVKEATQGVGDLRKMVEWTTPATRAEMEGAKKRIAEIMQILDNDKGTLTTESKHKLAQEASALDPISKGRK